MFPVDISLRLVRVLSDDKIACTSGVDRLSRFDPPTKPTASVMQSRVELKDDYSHYKFECEENPTHLDIQGILRKQEKSECSKTPDDNKNGALTPT